MKKIEWDKVYCKNCKKYLGRLDPRCCFCNDKCKVEFYAKDKSSVKEKTWK